MKTIHPIYQVRAGLIACGVALLWTAGAALAAEPEHAGRPAPSHEMREKMAGAHEQMAACLRSDRPIADCHGEMMKNHGMMHPGEDGHEGMGHEGMTKEDCAHWAHHDHEMKESMEDHAAAKPAQK